MENNSPNHPRRRRSSSFDYEKASQEWNSGPYDKDNPAQYSADDENVRNQRSLRSQRPSDDTPAPPPMSDTPPPPPSNVTTPTTARKRMRTTSSDMQSDTAQAAVKSSSHSSKQSAGSAFNYAEAGDAWNDRTSTSASSRRERTNKQEYSGQSEHSSNANTQTRSNNKGGMSVIKKILLVPVILLALLGALFVIGIVATLDDENIEQSNPTHIDADSIATDEALSDSTYVEEVVSDTTKVVHSKDELQMPSLSAQKNRNAEMVEEYRTKAKKILSVYVTASELSELKKEFESLPTEVQKMMPKEEKQLYYYSMFFNATAPNDIKPLKHYAKAYFTAEQVWMLERTYLHSNKRFYEVYNLTGMSFSGAREVYLRRWDN